MAEKTTKVQQLRTEIAELLKEQYLEIARKMASQTREPEAYKALYDVPAEGLTFLNGAYEWAEDTASEEAKAVQDFARPASLSTTLIYAHDLAHANNQCSDAVGAAIFA